MMAPCNGTDERLDLIIQQNNRRNEQLDELIALGKRAIAAIQDVLTASDDPNLVASPDAAILPDTSPDVASGAGADRQEQRGLASDVKEPARKRKKP